MKFLTQLFHGRTAKNHRWLDDPEDSDGVVGLPQVAQSARLIVDPSIEAGTATSFAGGDPLIPADIPWPEAEGTPMGFVMQVDCSKLPKSLWGGFGPRDGYLSVFVTGDSNLESMPLEVIYHQSLGKARQTPSMPKPDWRLNAVRGPKIAIRVVSWPTAHRDQNSVGPTPERCFQEIEDMMPLTWGHAAELFEALADRLGRTANRKRRVTVAQVDAPSRPWENHHHSAVREIRTLRRSALARVLWLFRMANRANPAARLTENERQTVLAELRNITWPSKKEICLRPGLTPIGYRATYANSVEGEPTTLGELRSAFSASWRAWKEMAKDVDAKLSSLNFQVERCEKADRFVPPEGVPNYDRTELKRATEELEDNLASLRDFQEEVAERLLWFEEAGKSFDGGVSPYGFVPPDPVPIPDNLTEIAKNLLATGHPQLTPYEISDALYPILTLEHSPQRVLERGTSIAEHWSRLWHMTAAELAFEDRTLLPDGIRGPFMKWLTAKLAFIPHQMGGIPRDCHFENRWFKPVRYVTEAQRKEWFEVGGKFKDGVGNKDFWACDPPFDGENALAFHLFSDYFVDWNWGDNYTILFAIPFNDLREGKWVRVQAEVTN